MKKKILAVCLVVALISVLAVSGTMAYLTDKDDAVNVMTFGKVDIEQNELQRNEEGAIADEFEQEKKLYPAVNLIPDGESFTVENEDGVKLFNENLHNVVDKFVNVTVDENSEECYIRTIIAFETKITYVANTDQIAANLHDQYFLVNGTFEYLYHDDAKTMPLVIEIDGTEYWLAVCVYEDAYAAKETTPYSLRQIAMTWDAGNEAMDWFGEEYNILCLSQAVQTAGFTSVGADVALNSAFGEIDLTNATAWFTEIAQKEAD